MLDGLPPLSHYFMLLSTTHPLYPLLLCAQIHTRFTHFFRPAALYSQESVAFENAITASIAEESTLHNDTPVLPRIPLCPKGRGGCPPNLCSAPCDTQTLPIYVDV
jgi:hypothetical protein